MNVPLLQVLGLEKPTRPGGTPVMMEFPVNPEMTPLLVSSTRSVLWRPRGVQGKVRAALRDTTMDAYFREVVASVHQKSIQEGWGSVTGMTETGVREAMDHLRYYDLVNLEVLVHPNFDWGRHLGMAHPITLHGCPVLEAEWMPLHQLVVVPMDREYLGFVLRVQGQLVSVVHNAPRGIGIVVGKEADDERVVDDSPETGGSSL